MTEQSTRWAKAVLWIGLVTTVAWLLLLDGALAARHEIAPLTLIAFIGLVVAIGKLVLDWVLLRRQRRHE